MNSTVTIMHQPSCTKYGPGNDSEAPDTNNKDTKKSVDMPFNRLGRIRRSLKGKEALAHFKTMSNVSNACKITEQLEDGTSIIDYIDLKRVQFDQDFQRTSFIQSQETERLQNIKYIEEKRTRELNNIKKTFKVAHRFEDVVQKRWVKKTRMVRKEHTCIHEELVEKSMLVGTVKIQRDFQEQQKTSYIGVSTIGHIFSRSETLQNPLILRGNGKGLHEYRCTFCFLALFSQESY